MRVCCVHLVRTFVNVRFFLAKEVSWLPSWLHQEVFDGLVLETQASARQAFEDLFFDEENISSKRDASTTSRKEGRYNCCKLFLSGEDNSGATTDLPSGNALHLHLRLSSDDSSSQSLQCSLFDASQTEKHGSINAQQANTVALPGRKDKNDADVAKFSPISPHLKGSHTDVGRNEETCRVASLGSADIDDAIELCVAASEALVIHELIGNSSSSEALSAEALLEGAFRVKQARLKGLGYSFCYPSKENEDFDFSLDLDDFVMADAFEDVGLSVVINLDNLHVGDSMAHHVSQASILEEQHEGHFKFEDPMHMATCFGHTSVGKQLEDRSNICLESKDSHNKILIHERPNNLSAYPSLDTNTCNVASCTGPVLQLFIQENSDSLSMEQNCYSYLQRVGIATADLTPCQLKTICISLPHVLESEKAGNYEETHMVLERFRSRWFGGWVGKEEGDASPGIKPGKHTYTTNAFVGETSFLSESADIAADGSSFVENHKIDAKMGSHPNKSFELSGGNKQALLSQDVTSPSLSSMDPLCSVVPCSISLDNADDHQSFDENHIEIDLKILGAPSDTAIEKLQGISAASIGVCNSQKSASINGEHYGAKLHGQLSSLKSYSVQVSDQYDCLERDTANGFLPIAGECYWKERFSERKFDSCKLSGKSNSEKILSFSLSKCTVSKDDAYNLKTPVSGDPVTDRTDVMRYCEENVHNENDLQLRPWKHWSSPLTLNQNVNHCFQASKNDVVRCAGEKRDRNAMQEIFSRLQNQKNLKMPLIGLKNLHDDPVPIVKRVRFSESDFELQQNKELLKRQPVKKNCSNLRTCNWLKRPSRTSNSQVPGLKRCQKSSHMKDENKLFHGLRFLLTGYSARKEKVLEELIRKYGGSVLPYIPSLHQMSRREINSRCNQQQSPIVLCMKKLKTTKFLYGCAVNALILKGDWLIDSIAVGCVLPPKRYKILLHGRCSWFVRAVCCKDQKYIFDKVGIMLHGKQNFFTKLAKVFKHGSGLVFKTLHSLVCSLESKEISVGAIVAEDESRVSRHLRHCAAEQKIFVVAVEWIVKSLHSGKVLPLTKKEHASVLPAIIIPESQNTVETNGGI